MVVSVEITEEPLRFVTRGLKSRLSVELSAIVDDKKLVQPCAALLRFIADYVERENALICDAQTLAYGFWLLKFKLVDGDILKIYELTDDGESFVPGVSHAVTIWDAQPA